MSGDIDLSQDIEDEEAEALASILSDFAWGLLGNVNRKEIHHLIKEEILSDGGLSIHNAVRLGTAAKLAINHPASEYEH